MVQFPLRRLGGATLLVLVALGCNISNNSSAGTEADEQISSDSTSESTETPSDTESGDVSTDEECSQTVIEPSLYNWANGAYPYHACGDAVAIGNEPIISNFDNCTFSVLPNEGRGGSWFSFDDGSDGTLTMEVESGAAHFTSSNWTIWGSGVGCSVAPSLSNTEHCSYDASPYAGIRFKAKGTGRIRLKVATASNVAVDQGGTCNRGENCYDLPVGYGRLTNEWQTFEIPFCSMFPEGWGGEVAPLDPSELVDLEFFLDAGPDVDLWIDDLAFFTLESAVNPVSCDKPCPLDLVPYPETTMPEFSYLTLSDELTLHTFDQETTRCGTIRRRYLSYVPSQLAPSSSAPVLIALHGTHGNAESFQNFLSHGKLDELAARDGFIVVYGNGAPGVYSGLNPQWLNSSTWRQGTSNDGDVDDVAYLEMVLADLQTLALISGNNDIYLLGLSNGGGMVLKAAAERPALFKGIAPFMPWFGWNAIHIPDFTGTGLERILLGLSPEDPGLPEGYDFILTPLPTTLAEALGLPADVIDNPIETNLPNLVHEGADYSGSSPVALRTQNSSVTQLDMSSPAVPGKLRVLKFNRGGHLWPVSEQDTDMHNNETYGFRNQDVDASEQIWSFFRDTDSGTDTDTN